MTFEQIKAMGDDASHLAHRSYVETVRATSAAERAAVAAFEALRTRLAAHQGEVVVVGFVREREDDATAQCRESFLALQAAMGAVMQLWVQIGEMREVEVKP